MGMYHSSSGKAGFDYYASPSPSSNIPIDTMRDILIREDELRASQTWQDEYSKEDNLRWFEEVTYRIQLQALMDNGISEGRLNVGICALKSARFMYKDDPDMNQLTVYMRHDRSRKGSLQQGDDTPNVPLHTIEGTPIMLHDYIKNLNSKKPLFVMAGSLS